MTYLDDFLAQGYAGPYPLLNKRESELLVSRENLLSNLLLPTVKQRHVTSQAIASVALRKEILEKIKPILGDNILLSGSQLIHQHADAIHEWHVDTEHTEWEGITVWVGLKNVIRKECMRVITRSHKFDVTPDDLKCDGLDLYNDTEVLNQAQKLSPDAELIEIDVSDGEFFIFDGLTWHASRNLTQFTRYALVLQYCNTGQKVKSLKSRFLPKVVWEKSNPECLLINGKDESHINKIIPTKQIGSYDRLLKSVLYYLPKNMVARRRKIAMHLTSQIRSLFLNTGLNT